MSSNQDTCICLFNPFSIGTCQDTNRVGVKALISMLKGCDSLVHLSLAHCRLLPEDCQRLSEPMRMSRSLLAVHMEGNHFVAPHTTTSIAGKGRMALDDGHLHFTQPPLVGTAGKGGGRSHINGTEGSTANASFAGNRKSDSTLVTGDSNNLLLIPDAVVRCGRLQDGRVFYRESTAELPRPRLQGGDLWKVLNPSHF